MARPDQPLRDHLLGVAGLAGEFAARFGAQAWGETCGLLHDIGKASGLFQQRLRGETARKVDHSTAGARHIVEVMGQAGQESSLMLQYPTASPLHQAFSLKYCLDQYKSYF